MRIRSNHRIAAEWLDKVAERLDAENLDLGMTHEEQLCLVKIVRDLALSLAHIAETG